MHLIHLILIRLQQKQINQIKYRHCRLKSMSMDLFRYDNYNIYSYLTYQICSNNNKFPLNYIVWI